MLRRLGYRVKTQSTSTPCLTTGHWERSAVGFWPSIVMSMEIAGEPQGKSVVRALPLFRVYQSSRTLCLFCEEEPHEGHSECKGEAIPKALYLHRLPVLFS